MDRDKILIFADHLARFYAERYSMPPVVGRLIGYLAVCQPMEQSINDIAKALLTSRSAINSAIKVLENMKHIQRTRPAGTRADLISLSPLGWENTGFEPSEYTQMAALAREGLELLKDASPERRQPLETMASLNDFLAQRLPELYEEWTSYRKDQSDKQK
ncbi:MAG TPA: MarR family winged helix-turn-helix transcriptional regulator [Candidatus Saccharimonadales bacterium]|nr:MarR family winged helix-turn-helix transcriptional regulator [Candidatus Saccharimonadales bacterium]